MKKKLLAIMCLTVALTITGCGQDSADSTYEKEIEELESKNEELESENEELKKEIEELKAQLYDIENSQPETSEEKSELDGFVAETSGVCGPNLTWEYGNGILKISGTGEMTYYTNYWSGNDRPWEEIKDKINWVYVDEGCTSIEGCALENMNALSKVVFPKSLEVLDVNAIRWNQNLKIIIWGNDEYSVNGVDSDSLKILMDLMINDGHNISDFTIGEIEIPNTGSAESY